MHPHTAEEPVWNRLPHLLLAAFLLRAVLSLSGDFVIHPDEIMQYLEPARRLVFDSGIVYWEYFYGARSWLVPGFVAAVMWLCKGLGLDSPMYYIGAVKLAFCLLSLLIPAGMYFFARRHWSEKTARLALLLGVFWYELFGFAHKPMTEFAAAALLLGLLAFAPLGGSSEDGNNKRFAAAGALAVFIVAVRFQYAPAAALLLLAGFYVGRGNERWAMIGGGLLTAAAVAVLEWLTWGVPFHSYYVNTQMNLIVGGGRAGESTLLHMPLWLLLASGGLFAFAAVGAVENFRRRGFILLLSLAILIPHMLQHHREYRFLFALIPLWLLLFADFAATLSARKNTDKINVAAIAAAGIVSVVGILNYLPFQGAVYRGFSFETGKNNFIRGQDAIFKIYRMLSGDDSVRGVLDSTRPYFNTGGYYYLGRNVPFYDRNSAGELFNGRDTKNYASHIITDDKIFGGEAAAVSRGGELVSYLKTEQGPRTLPAYVYDGERNELAYWNLLGERTPLADYVLSGNEGGLHLWTLKTPAPIREWKHYRVAADAVHWQELMHKILGDSTPPPPSSDYGIEFSDSE